METKKSYRGLLEEVFNMKKAGVLAFCDAHAIHATDVQRWLSKPDPETGDKTSMLPPVVHHNRVVKYFKVEENRPELMKQITLAYAAESLCDLEGIELLHSL